MASFPSRLRLSARAETSDSRGFPACAKPQAAMIYDMGRGSNWREGAGQKRESRMKKGARPFRTPGKTIRMARTSFHMPRELVRLQARRTGDRRGIDSPGSRIDQTLSESRTGRVERFRRSFPGAGLSR